jgi:hypothetical protein
MADIAKLVHFANQHAISLNEQLELLAGQTVVKALL